MRVDEFFNPIIALLHRNMLLSEAPIGTAIVSRTWQGAMLGGEPDRDFKLLGKLGRFKIGVQSEWSDSIDYAVDVLILNSSNISVGKINITRDDRSNKKIAFWSVHQSILRKDLQGRGIMPKVYAFLVNHGYNLRADSDQSAGGQNIWSKLARDPTVNVYAALYNEKTGEFEFSDVDGARQLQANFYLYQDEMDEELKYIENEIESLRDIRDRINDDYLALPKDDEEAEKKLDDEFNRLTAQIDKLDSEYSELKYKQRDEARKELYLVAIPADQSMPVNEDDDDEEQRRENQSDLEMVQIDGMNIMYLNNPREAVQLAAVKQNPYAIYEIDNLKSKTVILTAILGLLKRDSLKNAKRLTIEFRKKYPDWPEWETITRSIRAIQ